MHRGRVTRVLDRLAGDDLSVDSLSHAVQETTSDA
jgi:hypothetical protein